MPDQRTMAAPGLDHFRVRLEIQPTQADREAALVAFGGVGACVPPACRLRAQRLGASPFLRHAPHTSKPPSINKAVAGSGTGVALTNAIVPVDRA